MTIQDQLNSLLTPLRRKIFLMVNRAIINLIDDAGGLQLVQLDRLADETTDKIERLSDYGFDSHPPLGSEGLVVSVGGVRSHSMLIACGNRQYRLKGLASGEVAMSDDLGQKVHLTRAGIVVSSPLGITMHSDTSLDFSAPEVTFTANSITLDADTINATGDLVTGGDLEVDGDAHITGDLSHDGNGILGYGAVKFVKLADGTNSTKVKAA